MLRVLVVLLLLANLLFWAWHQPWVAQALGLPGPDSGREPERLARQFRPDEVRLLTPAGAAAPAARAPADAAALRPGEAGSAASAVASDSATGASLCLETGPLGDSASAAATRELAQAGVPAGAWVDMRRERPGRWILYMGRFSDREALQRKAEELQRLNLSVTELRSPPDLAPGLALGEFGAQADAQARLTQLQNRGVRTAKVQQLPSPGAEHRLRVDRLEPAAAERLAGLSGASRWQPCAPP